jgi:hypothetical protein
MTLRSRLHRMEEALNPPAPTAVETLAARMRERQRQPRQPQVPARPGTLAYRMQQRRAGAKLKDLL